MFHKAFPERNFVSLQNLLTFLLWICSTNWRSEDIPSNAVNLQLFIQLISQGSAAYWIAKVVIRSRIMSECFWHSVTCAFLPVISNKHCIFSRCSKWHKFLTDVMPLPTGWSMLSGLLVCCFLPIGCILGICSYFIWKGKINYYRVLH
jgi:hypothetical protein